jgi:hypothetical protein
MRRRHGSGVGVGKKKTVARKRLVATGQIMIRGKLIWRIGTVYENPICCGLERC